MKICPNCGKKFNDNENYCNACGSNLSYVANSEANKEENNAKTFGILSIVFSPTFIVGLILGIIGLKKSTIKNEKNLNIIGICLSVASLIIAALIIGFMFWLVMTFADGVTTITQEGTEAILGQ